MWGNKPGWFISAVILAVMGWMLWSFGRPEGVSPPSGKFNLAEGIKLPVSPEEALPGVMTEDRDAGDLYQQAIRIYQENPRGYDNFEVKHVERIPDLRALAFVTEGTTAKHAKIFAGKPETLVNYRFPWADLDALFALGQVCNSIGYYYVVSPKNANDEQAAKFLHAGFSLGAKLFDERLVHNEMQDGLKLMQGAADAMREQAKRKGDKTREAALKNFSDQTSTYYTTKVQPLYQKVVSATRQDVATYAGDVFEMARHNPDRMWRVEAILKVGRYKFDATRRGDQFGAERLLGDNPEKYGFEDLSKSEDPAVRAAVKAAKELTIEQYRMIR
jgi:hypothetical protein